MELEYAKSLLEQDKIDLMSEKDLFDMREAFGIAKDNTSETVFQRLIDARRKQVIADPLSHAQSLEAWSFLNEGYGAEVNGSLQYYNTMMDEAVVQKLKALPTATDADLFDQANVYALLQYVQKYLPTETEAVAKLDGVSQDIIAKLTAFKADPKVTSDEELATIRYLSEQDKFKDLLTGINFDELKTQLQAQDGNDMPLPTQDNIQVLNSNAQRFAGVKMAMSKELETVWNLVEIEEMTAPSDLTKEERKKQYLEALNTTVQAELTRQNLANAAWAQMKPVDFEKAVQEAYNLAMFRQIITSAAASGYLEQTRQQLGLPEATDAEKAEGSTEQKAFIANIEQRFQDTVADDAKLVQLYHSMADSLTQKPQQMKVKAAQLLVNHAEVDVDMERYTRRLQRELIAYDQAHEATAFDHASFNEVSKIHQQVVTNGEKTFGKKNYNLAVKMTRFAKNHPGKIIDLAGTALISGAGALLSSGVIVSNPIGWTVAGAMVAHYAAKSFIYPAIDKMKALRQSDPEFAKKSLWAQYREGFKRQREENKYWKTGAIGAGVTLAIMAAAAQVPLVGPLGARAAGGMAFAGVNAFKSWIDRNNLARMYKKTGDPKYKKQLEGIYSKEDIANTQNPFAKFFKQVARGATSKNGVAILATVGAATSASFVTYKLSTTGYNQLLTEMNEAPATDMSKPEQTKLHSGEVLSKSSVKTVALDSTQNNAAVNTASGNTAGNVVADTSALNAPVDLQAELKSLPAFKAFNSNVAALEMSDKSNGGVVYADDTFREMRANLNQEMAALAKDPKVQALVAKLSPEAQAEFNKLATGNSPEMLNKFLGSDQFAAPLPVDAETAGMIAYKTPEDVKYRAMVHRQCIRKEFDDYKGGKLHETAAQYLARAESVTLTGKPAGMTTTDYIFHRNMLREYIGIRGEKDLMHDLKGLGISREQWNGVLAGKADQATVDKVFSTRLGGHATRLLIERDVDGCEKMTLQQRNLIARGMAMINKDPNNTFANGKLGYYTGPGAWSYEQNPIKGPVDPHFHANQDCHGETVESTKHLEQGEMKAKAPAPEAPKAPEASAPEAPKAPETPAPTPDPVVEVVAGDAKLEFATQANEYQAPAPVEQGVRSINRFKMAYAADVKSGQVFKPSEKEFLTFGSEQTDRIDINDLPLKEGKNGEWYVDTKALKETSGGKLQDLYWHRLTPSGELVPSKQDWSSLVINNSGSAGGELVDAKPFGYSPDQVQQFIASHGMNVKPGELGVADNNNKFFMVTDKGLLYGSRLPETDKIGIQLVDFENKPTTGVTVEDQNTLFAEMQKKITDLKLKSNIPGNTVEVEVEQTNAPAAATTENTAAETVAENAPAAPQTDAELIGKWEERLSIKKGEMSVKANPENVTQHSYTTLTDDGVFMVIQDGKNKVLGTVGFTLSGDKMTEAQLNSGAAKKGLEGLNKTIKTYQTMQARQMAAGRGK